MTRTAWVTINGLSRDDYLMHWLSDIYSIHIMRDEEHSFIKLYQNIFFITDQSKVYSMMRK